MAVTKSLKNESHEHLERPPSPLGFGGQSTLGKKKIFEDHATHWTLVRGGMF